MPKTYLITGASRGIGWNTAQRLAKCGHHVVGIARTESAQKFPGEFIKADFSSANIGEVLLEINKRWEIDGLINNVGMAIPSDFSTIALADYEQVMNLNLYSVIKTAQIFVPTMLKKGQGRIVNIASRAMLGLEGNSVYAASKAGMVGFARSLALELAKTGITVNTVAPGPIETDMYRAHRPEGSKAANERLAKIPMGRIGKPEEVAAVVEFLLSLDAGYITGQTIFVDGGMSIGSN